MINASSIDISTRTIHMIFLKKATFRRIGSSAKLNLNLIVSSVDIEILAYFEEKQISVTVAALEISLGKGAIFHFGKFQSLRDNDIRRIYNANYCTGT